MFRFEELFLVVYGVFRLFVYVLELFGWCLFVCFVLIFFSLCLIGLSLIFGVYFGD